MSRLQSAYGEVVDAWEIDNEPDIAFVIENPETYAAYLKACWWGAYGAEEGGPAFAVPTAGERRTAAANDGSHRLALNAQLPGRRPARPLVLMGAMAMPPGPYLERFAANDGLSYTDGFNYHFYGYAQDFSGVYRQFERAVRELATEDPPSPRLRRAGGGPRRGDQGGTGSASSVASGLKEKTLPVFITESGYSMLSGEAGREKEGRLRQWEHFRDVGTQARKLRIEGAMAFLFTPYIEYGAKEYGLTMRAAGGKATEAEIFNTEGAESAEQSRPGPKNTDQGPKGPEDGGPNVERGKAGMVNGGRGTEDGLNSDRTRIDSGENKPNRKVWLEQKTNRGRAESGKLRTDNAGFAAGGLAFTPGDFGAKRVEPWMEEIGQNIGGNEASPAMAWLMADAKKPRKPSRGWKIETPEPCAVVIDFVRGPELWPMKQCQGYFLSSSGDRKSEGGLHSAGTGELRVYNLGEEPITGKLDLGAYASCADLPSLELTLSPGELRVLPVTLALTADAYRAKEWRVRFLATKLGEVSSFSTLLFPSMRGMVRKTLTALTASEAGPHNTRSLANRSLAKGEPLEVSAGSWRLTPGVDVRAEGDTWTFTVNRFPDAPTRSAFAEWVLPDDFRLPTHSLLNLEYRLVELGAETGPSRVPTVADRSPLQRDAIGIYWRTAEGSLFTVWRSPAATKAWQRYGQSKESFTMAFYGRAGKHWRFSDNRPVALVFTFLPGALPTTFQVRKAEIIEYVRAGVGERKAISCKCAEPQRTTGRSEPRMDPN